MRRARSICSGGNGSLLGSGQPGCYPKGDLFPSTYVSPRLGVAWRPKGDLVVWGAYGIFACRGMTGNTQASAIVGSPYWNYESEIFSAEFMQI